MQNRTNRCRTLHLVDLENLLGEQRKHDVARGGLVHYLELARWSPGDQVVVAADHEIIRQIGFDKPVTCSLHAVRGEDAADTVLLGGAPAELVARRYDRLVIGSGDHIFLRRAMAVRDLGVGVLIVARADGCSRGYRRAGLPVAAFDGSASSGGGTLALAA